MSLVRSTLLVGAASAASRVLGFLRDVLFAQVLGAGPVADAFLAAFRLPNLLRRVLGEGGLNPALVPVLTRLEPEAARRFTGEAFGALALGLVALTGIVEVLAGGAVLILAPGLRATPETLALATLYTRLAFPLVVGVTLASFAAAALNQRRRFAATALAPLVVNAALIGLMVYLHGRSDLSAEREASWLAAGSSVAGLAQLAWVTVALQREDAMAFSRPRWSPALKGLLGTAVLTIAASAASQLFVLVGTQVGSFLPSGIAWLYYADRVAQLPVGLIASTAGVVLLPELARHHIAGAHEAVVAAQNRALELAALIALPAALALAILAEPIAIALFERGAFTAADSAGTAEALTGLSLSIPLAVMGKVLSQTLFARGAIRETLLALLLGLAATFAGAMLLSGPLGVFGIGVGIAFGSLVHVGTIVQALRRERLWHVGRPVLARLGRILPACLLLGAGLLAGRHWLPPGSLALAALCAGGFTLYAGAAWLFGALTREEWTLLAKKA